MLIVSLAAVFSFFLLFAAAASPEGISNAPAAPSAETFRKSRRENFDSELIFSWFNNFGFLFLENHVGKLLISPGKNKIF